MKRSLSLWLALAAFAWVLESCSKRATFAAPPEPAPVPVAATPEFYPVPETSQVSPAALPTPVPPLENPVMNAPPLESPNLQEQLKWAEQRAVASEAQAQGAQRSVVLVLMILLFALPLAFAGGVVFARYKNYQRLNQLVRSLMERGVAVPPEMLTPILPKGPSMSDLRKGLILVWSGVGAAVLLGTTLHGTGAWGLGMIPIFTGVAYLVLWRIERRKVLTAPSE